MSGQDVIIVGAGSWGLACAYACAKRGMRVRVFEAGVVGCGASGGIVGALAPHVPDQWNQKKQFQFEALCNAPTFWGGVDKQSGLDSGYGRIGRVMPLQTSRAFELAVPRVQTSQSFWQGRFTWEVLDSHPLINAEFAPFGVVRDNLSARVFPANAVASLAGACRALGVEIVENRPILSVDARQVSGDWGHAGSDVVVIAAGVGGKSLLDQHFSGVTGRGVKGQAALLGADMGQAPLINGEGVYIIPHGKRGVAVGSTSERQWDDPLATDEKLDEVIRTARALCPVLAGAPVSQRWAGIRPKVRLPDAMIGPLPGLEGVFSALGGFKIGLGLAPKIGEVLADLVQGKPVDLPRVFTIAHHFKERPPLD